MRVEAGRERIGFQAEVVQLLDLMIHSRYSRKEIFLRELISNASDAVDRLRLEALSEPGLYEDESGFRIRVVSNSDARTITVADTGIGMDRQEVIENIGTIARSGTREFLKTMNGEQRRDANLIGQFGVGFYSAFMVAERVTLTTRRAGRPASEGVRWESDGRGEYTLEAVERHQRGTEVVLYLREGEDQLLRRSWLRTIIQTYSDHISLPILVAAEGEEGREETVNQASALWARPESEISEQEYAEFYRHLVPNRGDPLAHVHTRIEGDHECTLLLFIPARPPFELWHQPHGIELYVRRVFIEDYAEHLLPHYLRFVVGVVDSPALPLNACGEIPGPYNVLQDIRSKAAKKVLDRLKELASDEPEKYASFWRQFGSVLKEGIGDYREEIAWLLRFTSTRSTSDTADVSLADYVGRLKEGQETIYYLIAPDLASAKGSPLLEIFRRKEIEVLLLGDSVDTWMVNVFEEFEGRKLQSVVTRGAEELEDEAEKQAREVAAAALAGLVRRLESVLGDKVQEVRLSSRLTDSPACLLVTHSELKFIQNLRTAGDISTKVVLAINPAHPVLQHLADEVDDARFSAWVAVLYDQAVLALGGEIQEPAAYVTHLNDLLVALVQEG